jgi:hypothetical protein
MTILFPREMPTFGFDNCDFDLKRVDAVNRSNGGAIDAIELAEPYWSMTAKTVNLSIADRGRWQAWKASLKGSKTFYAFDPDKVYPAAYGKAVLALLRYGGAAFDGTARLTGTTAGAISIADLPPNFAFTWGDHVSIGMSVGTRRSLHVIQADVAGSNLGTATVAVEPPVRAGADLAAAVQLVRPTCIMKLVPGSFSAPGSGRAAPVSFQGAQPLV